MTAIADLDDFVNRMTGGASGNPVTQMVFKAMGIGQNEIDTFGNGRWVETWRLNGNPAGGTIPTTVAAPNRTTQGAIPWTNPTGGREKFITGFSGIGTASGVTAPMGHTTALLYDRLLHKGGLSTTVTTAQTVGGTLTRNTGGAGNRIYIENEGDLTSAARWIEATYTNQSGVSGRTTIQVYTGTTDGYKYINACALELPLQAGDYGVRSVESIRIQSSLVTGTLACGIGRPLAWSGMHADMPGGFDDALGLHVVPVEDDACLSIMMAVPDTDSGAHQFCITSVEA